MKNVALLLGVLLVLSGCSSMEELGRDYMKTDEWKPDTLQQASHDFQKDVLRAELSTVELQEIEEVKSQAQMHLLDTAEKDNFDFNLPIWDDELGMPEAMKYFFIYFDPYSDDPALGEKVYLVVISRMGKKIVYSGVYEKPAGDSFYRYSDILKGLH